MTIEEKAKAYDERLAKARKEYSTHEANNAIGIMDALERVFPELAEPEDERIRNIIYCLIRDRSDNGKLLEANGCSVEKALNWLEKQGEKDEEILVLKDQIESLHTAIKAIKETHRIELEKQGGQKLIDKIQLGKKYRCIASPRYSTFMTGETYKPEDKFLCSLMNFCSDCFEPVEDGEQKLVEEVNGKDYGIDGLYAASDILEKTLGKVQGYQTDDGILEHKAAITAVKKLQEQKPAEWINELEEKLSNATPVQLKEWKEKYFKDEPVEWSEEDDKMINSAIDACKYMVDNFENSTKQYEDAIAWLKNRLKSLRPQKQWKPSEKQMYILKWVSDVFLKQDSIVEKSTADVLGSLYEQLKAL